jgi:hypothetical protein
MADRKLKYLWAGLALLLVACQPGMLQSLIPAQFKSTAAILTPPPATMMISPTQTPKPAPTLKNPATPVDTQATAPTRMPTWTPYPARPKATSSLLGLFGFPPDVDPLTGLKSDNPKILDRRPVMVKISNFPSNARPQAGLSFADIVFEYYIGEFMYRFMGVFYGQDVPQAGPIRSGRYVDAQLVNQYGGLLMYGSADKRVDDVIRQVLGDRAMNNLEAPCPVVCGGDTHLNRVVVDTGKFTQFARENNVNENRPDLTGMVFDPQPPQGDQLAVQIAVQYVKFYRGEWRYDPTTRLYMRWIDDDSLRVPPPMVPLKDSLTGNQLAFDNLVIIFATYIVYNPTLHDIEIWKNTTGKRALFFRDGVMTEGLWKSAGYDRPLQFFNRWGLPYALKPGNTWIVIAGDSSVFEQPAPGQWELRFDLP